MNKITKILFFIIIIFGLLTRFYQLSQYPPSLNWDEISHGYNAYSLLLTGKDQWGIKWPIFNTRAYGDYPTMANIYLTIPFIKLFGLSPLTTRLPSAVCGFLMIPFTFFLVKKLLSNTTIAIITMFMVLISPWTFFPSRAVFQSTIAQYFLLQSVVFFLYKDHFKFLTILSAISIGISMYAYHNTRIFIPIFLLVLFIKYFKLIRPTKTNLASIFILLIFLIPQLLNIINPDSQARSRWVFLINPASINEINNLRNSAENPLIGKFIYNKFTYLSYSVIKNYLNFLNPIPLFIKGTQNYQFNIPGFGIMPSATLPFFYLGLIITLFSIKQARFQFIILWFILGLIPAALTYGDYPVIRMMSIIPIPYIFISLGIAATANYFRKYSSYFYVVVTFILCFQFYNYLHNYIFNYSQNYSQSWQYGYSQAVSYLKDNYSKYDHIYFTKKYGEPHEFILYYWPWDPSKYQNDPNKNWNFHSDWYWVDSFDKFTFLNDWEVKSSLSKPVSNSLLITSPNNYPNNSTKLKTINFLNNSPAFDIVKL